MDNLNKMREYLEKEKQKSEFKKKKMKEITLNTKYIEWLDEFTLKYPRFRDNDFNEGNMLASDLEKINDLYFLYESISKYAMDNYIYPFIDADFVEYYKFKYNNVGYEIGIITGLGIISFCERTEKITSDFIDFNDVVNNKKQANTIYIESKLQEIHDKLLFYYNNGIPFEALNEIVEETIWELKGMNDKKKILRR